MVCLSSGHQEYKMMDSGVVIPSKFVHGGSGTGNVGTIVFNTYSPCGMTSDEKRENGKVTFNKILSALTMGASKAMWPCPIALQLVTDGEVLLPLPSSDQMLPYYDEAKQMAHYKRAVLAC